MWRPLPALALLLVATAGACKPTAKPPAPPATQAGLQFVERVLAPAADGAALPVIIALHGLGDRPEDFVHLFDGFQRPVRLIVPRAPIPYGKGAQWFPVRVRDQNPAALGAGMQAAAAQVVELITRIERDRKVLGRPILTGFSQGGMVTLAVAVSNPERIGYALPVGGWLPPPLWPTARKDQLYPPIRGLHGRDDRVVPFGPTEQSFRALRELGVDAQLIPFERVGHEIPGTMRDELYRMLNKALERTVATHTSSVAPQ